MKRTLTTLAAFSFSEPNATAQVAMSDGVVVETNLRQFFRLSAQVLRRLCSLLLFLLTLSATSAQAQSEGEIGFHQMFSGPLEIVPGQVFGSATVIGIGDALDAAGNVISDAAGLTGSAGPSNLGGANPYIAQDVTAAGNLYDAGSPELSTQLNTIDAVFYTDQGNPTTYPPGYQNAIGMRVIFTDENGAPAPISVEHFMMLDYDFSEWGTSFAFNNGAVVLPDVNLTAGSELQLDMPSPATLGIWGSDLNLPTVPAGVGIPYFGRNGRRTDPNNIDRLSVFDYQGALVTELYFLFGQRETRLLGPQRSGVSSMTLGLPSFEVTKGATIGTIDNNGSYEIEYDVLVENIGVGPFDSVSLADLLQGDGGAFEGAFASVSQPSVTPVTAAGGSIFPSGNPSFDGSAANSNLLSGTTTLEPGDSFLVEYTVTAIPGNAFPGPYINSVFATGNSDLVPGATFSEFSDNDDGSMSTSGDDTDLTDGIDGDDNTSNLSLPLPAPSPSIALTQSIAGVEDTNGNGVFGDAGDTVTYVYTAQNVGNTSLAGVGIAPGDEGFAVSLEGSSVFTPDPSFDLQSGTGGVLAIGSDPVVIGTATYVIAPSDVAAGQIVTQPTVTSTAVATGAGNVPLPGTPLVDAGGAALPPVTDVSDTGTGSNLDRADGSVPNIAEPGTSGTGNDPTVLLLQSTGEFLLTKSAGTERVLIGETVTYEIVATSLMASDFAPTQIVDTLPAGLVFTPGSATIDGVAVEAVVSGQTITFSDLTMPANGSLTIGLQARVLSSAPAGALTNVVDLLDQLTGDALAQTASATVTRTVESVFDCSPVIGKVFDDVNMNGYQDEAPARGAIISDQDIFVDKLGNGGKLSSANVVPQAEVGMPGVRLVTPSGTIITTDANGLYSVPCAEIPSGIGSNFMLKLDTRTLPTGYRMTTENPRVMRLTSGIMTEMNFGAAIGRVFDVDLSGRAYAGDQIAPSAALVDGLNGVLRQIADTPTVVRISYYRNQETAELARDRLNAIEDLIEARWADIGTYRLLIEKSVNQLQ